uniref:Protein with signal anchor n=1 Tax=Rhabditophanes sp. KR3021 TaxID=114890 RepID=A0AC35TK57_9BILA
MGSSNSHHQMPEPMMMEQQPYPDLNQLLKGIPKMVQVADDMHRMTNYINDMRNMTFVFMLFSALGVMVILVCRILSVRRKRRSKKRIVQQQYEQNSLPHRYNSYEPHNWERVHKFTDLEKNAPQQITRSGTPHEYNQMTNERQSLNPPTKTSLNV